MFPFALPTDWQACRDSLRKVNDEVIADWLSSEASLTVRIKELGVAFNVDVLNQIEKPLSFELKNKLGCNDDSALFREVLLKQGEKALVYAQTIMPNSTVTGTEKMLASLGNQPLGHVLFQSPQATRGDIEFSQIAPSSALGNFIQNQLGQYSEKPIYIRRSLFNLNNKPLLVCECFLPLLFT